MFKSKFDKKILLTGFMLVFLPSCSLFDNKNESSDNFSLFRSNDGLEYANKATLTYSQGDFDKAQKYSQKSLNDNPKQTKALIVAALTAEKQGRINRARQYYEDITIYGNDETTILGSEDGAPHKTSEIAKKRLANLNLNYSTFIVDGQDGIKNFNISSDLAAKKSKSAMEEALFVRETRINDANLANREANVKAVELLFSDGEKNIVSRFLIIKELAEKDLMTKDEFLKARGTNIGGLLPLSKPAPSAGIDAPVPSPDVILDRIDALKSATEDRAITYREFGVERDMIIDAVLPKNPRTRMKNKIPSRDIMGAAKDLRKLEVIYDLGLITANEKAEEQKQIEKFVKTNKKETNTNGSTKSTASKPAVKKTEAPVVSIPKTTAITEETPKLVTPQPLIKNVEIKGVMKEYPANPDVSSPF